MELTQVVLIALSVGVVGFGLVLYRVAKDLERLRTDEEDRWKRHFTEGHYIREGDGLIYFDSHVCAEKRLQKLERELKEMTAAAEQIKPVSLQDTPRSDF